MKDVYVIIETHPYEFSEVAGVFALKWDAEMAKTALIMSDDSNGYDEFDIELHHIK